MYWPRNSGSENYVFLLAKNTKKGSDQTISKVYVSRDYGKNFTEQRLVSKNSKAALIHQIYSSKADPQLVSNTFASSSFILRFHEDDSLLVFF